MIATLIRILPIVVTFALLAVSAGCSETSGPVSDFRAATSDCSPSSPAVIHEPYCIEVTGHEYRWEVRYPGADGLLATNDDVISVRNVHVPQETDVVLLLKSLDYVYVMALPQFRLKELAVPTLEFQMSFHSQEAGQFALLGDELCGDPHPELKGHLIVEPREHFLAWLNLQGQKPSPPKPL
jgi:heme/copper-type cytochrome/quinol oxidase subunit 2